MESLSSRQRDILLDSLTHVKESIQTLIDWNKGVVDVNELPKSTQGMQLLTADCMLIQAICEGIKQIDNRTNVTYTMFDEILNKFWKCFQNLFFCCGVSNLSGSATKYAKDFGDKEDGRGGGQYDEPVLESEWLYFEEIGQQVHDEVLAQQDDDGHKGEAGAEVGQEALAMAEEVAHLEQETTVGAVIAHVEQVPELQHDEDGEEEAMLVTIERSFALMSLEKACEEEADGVRFEQLTHTRNLLMVEQLPQTSQQHEETQAPGGDAQGHGAVDDVGTMRTWSSFEHSWIGRKR